MELSIQPIDALLATLDAELLETLHSASGFSRALFDSHIQPLLDRLAECVQSLPLSRDAYNEPGGALRFGVISGLMAFRLADSAIFVPGHTAETRRVLDPQYRYSGFAAALASVPAILEAVMIVTVTGRRWSPMNQVSLTQALVDAEVREYTVNWNPSARAPSRMVAALVAGRFFVPDLWAGFEESVIAALADAILPIRGAIAVETPLCRVVRVAQDKAFEINAKETAKRIDALGGRACPARYSCATGSPRDADISARGAIPHSRQCGTFGSADFGARRRDADRRCRDLDVESGGHRADEGHQRR